MKVHTSKLVMLGVAVLASVGIVSCGGVASALEISTDYTVPAEGLTEELVVKSGSDVTITLNGDLTVTKADAIKIENGATATIVGNGTVEAIGSGVAPLFNSGTVNVNGGSFLKYDEKGNWYAIVNHGKMTINDGVHVTHHVVASAKSQSSMIENGYYEYNGVDERKNYVAGVNLANPELTINGGVFSGGNVNVKNDEGGIVTINGGEFVDGSRGVIQNWNVMTINDGTFTSGASSINSSIIQVSAYGPDSIAVGKLTISGGTFNGRYMFDEYDKEYATTTPVAISGGIFNVEFMTKPATTWGEAIQNPQITGGTFAKGVELPALPDGYEAIVDEDGTTSVRAESSEPTTDKPATDEPVVEPETDKPISEPNEPEIAAPNTGVRATSALAVVLSATVAIVTAAYAAKRALGRK